jgi:hypothetical protein
MPIASFWSTVPVKIINAGNYALFPFNMRYFTFGNPTEHIAAAPSPFNPGDDQVAWLINPPDEKYALSLLRQMDATLQLRR